MSRILDKPHEQPPPSVIPTGGEAPTTEPDHVLDRTHLALERIQAALRGLRFGTVTAVVQDGVVVQVERTEKVRLERRGRGR